jgi:hypothetical protein
MKIGYNIMEQRKQKIIDKKFQLHTTYSVMGIFFSLIFLIILMVGINYYNDNNKIEMIIAEQNNIMNEQSGIINSMLQILNIKGKDSYELSSKIIEKNKNNTELINQNMNVLKELIQRNNLIFLIVIAFLISMGFVLYPVIIRKTHKISGPIHIMSGYMNEIINGAYPDLRPLRKKDELKEFYELFAQLVKYIKNRDMEKANRN